MTNQKQKGKPVIRFIGYIIRVCSLLSVIIGTIGLIFHLPASIYFVVIGILVGLLGLLVGIIWERP
jgi:hypothetical protein